MNDSDLDFVDLGPKLLKRGRKKPDDQKQVKKTECQTSSQDRGEDKRKGNPKKDGIPGPRLVATQHENSGGQKPDESGETLCDSGDPGTSQQTAKDKVLIRMQQFKRDCPQKMVHKDAIQPINCPGLTQQQRDTHTVTVELQSDLQNNTDEALALQLQRELDWEAASAQTVDLEDEGLFFCQICHKDLSRMTPDGRTQHLNRCLDGIEETVPVPLPNPGILNCPICGKDFKSQKSRSAHLKRCSSDMGVSPAVLLQALQRQAEESQNITSNSHVQMPSNKRKGPTKPSLPAKKPKRKPKVLDEDTMVALALSSSLLEQQRKEETEGGTLTTNTASHPSVVKWGAVAGRGRVKKKRGAVPRPPPLLLVQNPEAALLRLQERVSALLLHSRPSSPPTPTRCTSTLPGWSGAAPLWRKAALLDEVVPARSGFYAAELSEFFPSSQAVTTDPTSLGSNKPESSVQLVLSEGDPVSIPQASSKTVPLSPAASSPGSGQLLVGSQALQDLMELAEDGMTLTQCGYTKRDHQSEAGPSTYLQLSGFVLEESEGLNELSASGFVPETAESCLEATVSRNTRTADSARAKEKKQESVALCRLAADLSGMVNNPQLSDVQLQVDSGEVFYAHTFMLYARCPLLAEMVDYVHESGIGVKEEGLPAAHRVLMNDVPGQAVFALLQFLYTSHCSIDGSVQPYVLELASRFDLQELERHCEETTARTHEENNINQVETTHTDEAFMELLRSMWMEGNEDEDGMDSGGEREHEGELEGEGKAEEVMSRIQEEQVNEEELEEIYEFAATQRKREVQEEERDEGLSFTKLIDPKAGSTGKPPQLNQSLDRSYNNLFSETWGHFDEGNFTSPMAHISDQHSSPLKLPNELKSRTLLQSSDNMSLSPPSTSNLPVAGQSPGRVADQSGGEDQGRDDGLKKPLKPQSICGPMFPESPRARGEPELIVLSDSSEETEMDAAVLRPLTETKPIPTSHQHLVEDKLPCSLSLSPDCSPELSWLIPSTPEHIIKGTSSSSAQTTSSMCRTQLFPKVQTIPPASPRHTSIGSISPQEAPEESRSDDASRNKAKRLTQDASTHKCYSSTPLHTELHRPRVPPTASMCDAVADPQRGTSESSPSFDQGRNNGELTEKDFTRRKERSGGDRTDKSNVGGAGDVGDADSSFQQCFMDMDEPPIAFNDSWGLDGGSDAYPEHFSLRLNDSGSTSQQESRSGEQSRSSSSSHSAPSRGRTLTPPLKDPPKQPSISPLPTASLNRPSTPEVDEGLMNSEIWDSWEEEEAALPLSQRVKPAAQLRTPAQNKRRRTMVPVTPMPHYSDMDTPDLKNKLDRFGVRPLPKRQMILKLREIHHYTHQLVSSDSEDEEPSTAPPVQGKPLPTMPASCASTMRFKEPSAPPAASPRKHNRKEDEEEPLSASQGSDASSSAASEEQERPNPELGVSSDKDSDSDGGLTASQASSSLQNRLLAVRTYILSQPELYCRILQYQPLVLSQFKEQLKAAGIRLGTAKLVDYLDSQCITFTTAKPGQPAAGRRRGKKTSTKKKSSAAASRKKGVTSKS